MSAKKRHGALPAFELRVAGSAAFEPPCTEGGTLLVQAEGRLGARTHHASLASAPHWAQARVARDQALSWAKQARNRTRRVLLPGRSSRAPSDIPGVRNDVAGLRASRIAQEAASTRHSWRSRSWRRPWTARRSPQCAASAATGLRLPMAPSLPPRPHPGRRRLRRRFGGGRSCAAWKSRCRKLRLTAPPLFGPSAS